MSVEASIESTTKALAKLTKKDAERETEKTRKMARVIESAWWDLAKQIRYCADNHIPDILGISFTKWVTDTLGESKLATAWTKLRIVRALKHFPEERVKLLTEGNATSLARLPEKERKQIEWLEQAETKPVAEFKEQVAKIIEKKTGFKREKWVHWFPTMPEGDKDILEAAEQKLARLFGFDLTQQPGLRVEIWKRAAVFFITTEDEHLIIESEGAWNQPSPKPNGSAVAAHTVSPSKDFPSLVRDAESSGS